MRHYLARAGQMVRKDWVKRFCPRHWTVDFPRPMMAAVLQPAPGRLRVELAFLTRSDLAGLIWESEDRWSHPLLRRETTLDYRGVVLGFRWRAGGAVAPLDHLFGAVLTIEGRDAAGEPMVRYVRLWPLATGHGLDARVELDFDRLRAGFSGEGETVFCGDVDRLFLSLVPAAYDGTGLALDAPGDGWVELEDVEARGPGSTLRIGDAFLGEHGLGICSAYDDSYHQSPERLVEQWLALGYRGLVTHYVGMSHFPRLAPVGDGRFEAVGGVVGPALAWHRGLLRAASAHGFRIILSLSFELFDANAPDAWAQRTVEGGRALTGWSPPSTLLSPCNEAALAWLEGIAAELMGLAAAEGVAADFQVGEPWWWVGPDGLPCFYDAATLTAFEATMGVAAPAMHDVDGERTPAERLWLDWLGAALAAATDRVAAAAVAAGGSGTRRHLLFYAPQVLSPSRPELRRANMPVGWAFPAWEVLQLEDYGFVTGADVAGMQAARAAVADALGYPVEAQHYLSGFVLDPLDRLQFWPRIMAAAVDAAKRGVAAVFLWAWPQIARDGLVAFDLGSGLEGEGWMSAFDDVLFPLEIGLGATGGPEFRTEIATSDSGHEQRNMAWAMGRLRYDAGLGLRSEDDLRLLVRFFRARRGMAHAFRFRDPMDDNSTSEGGAVSSADQVIGLGDGGRTDFELVKRYFDGGDATGEVRRILLPVVGTVRLAVGGVELADGWSLLAEGVVRLHEPPGPGVAVTAGFRFDVPVRFAEDRLDLSFDGWRSGTAMSVPLVEVRP